MLCENLSGLQPTLHEHRTPSNWRDVSLLGIYTLLLIKTVLLLSHLLLGLSYWDPESSALALSHPTAPAIQCRTATVGEDLLDLPLYYTLLAGYGLPRPRAKKKPKPDNWWYWYQIWWTLPITLNHSYDKKKKLKKLRNRSKTIAAAVFPFYSVSSPFMWNKFHIFTICVLLGKHWEMDNYLQYPIKMYIDIAVTLPRA